MYFIQQNSLMDRMRTFLKTSLVILAFFSVFFLLYEQAHSFMLHRDGNQYTRWFQADMPVHYSINPSGFPSGSIAAIQNGFQAWQDVTTATITFTYDGTTTVNTTGDDGTNVVMMVTNSSDWTHDGDVAAWTIAWVNASTGGIWSADTEFNGTPEFTQTYYSWSATGEAGTLDIQNLAAHEVGHYIGIDLADDPDATMYVYVVPDETKKRTLAQDDINAVSFLYPATPVNIEIVSGNGQQGPVGIELPQPLVVRVTDTGGTPVEGAFVLFDIPLGWGSGTLGDSSPVPTDASGLAQTTLTPGSDQKIRVRALAADMQEQVFWINNQAPVLEWTGETNYESDGLDPEVGYGDTDFIFRIKYTDADNDEPQVARVWIDIDGDDQFEADEKFAMSRLGFPVYTLGVIYQYEAIIPYSPGASNVKYYFEFSDELDPAGGITAAISPATAINAPDVLTNPTNGLPPLADAGVDQAVTDLDNDGSANVTLDGSASTDPDGTIVSYTWLEGGLGIATGVSPSVSFPVGTHAVILEVADDGGKTAIDTVVITVHESNVQPPTDGLVVYWPFDEGSGSVAGDASGSGNDGVIFEAAWTAGTIGGALSFDGEDDYVAVADSPTFNTNEVTFAFWIYPTALSKQWSTVMQKSNANGSSFDWQIYARAVDAPTPDHPVFRVDLDGDGYIDANEEVEGDVALATDTWYFIVCSYDGAQMKFYIDGTLRDSTSVSEGTIPNSGRDIWLGANDIWGEFFEGSIDEVRIYNRALSEEEIQLLAGSEPTNAPPVATDASVVTDENVALSGTLSANDLDGDDLIYSIVLDAARGTATITDPATGDFIYTPDTDANSNDSFTFKANDGTADSNIAKVTVTITPVNDAPTLSGTADITVAQDAFYSFTPTASDVDADPLTFSILNQPSWASFDTSTGKLSGTPTNADVGTTAGIVITVSDGELFSSLPPFDLTVINGNDVPVAKDASVVTDEDVALSGTLSATDADGDGLSFSIVSGAAKGTVAITDATAGTFIYIPAPDVNGNDSFTFRANDGQADSNQATVTVTITAVNDAPIASSVDINTDEDSTSGGVTPLVSDPDSGDSHSFTIESNASSGTASVVGNLLVYTPNADFSGSDSFSFRATDTGGLWVVGTARVSVDPINDTPTISGTPVTTVTLGAFYSFIPIASDVDGDGLTFDIMNQPSWATFDSTTGELAGTPSNVDVGTTTGIVITVSDGELFSSLPPFDLTVTVMVPDGLTVYWPFDEDSGSVAGDTSGSGNDGTILGAIWTAGAVGGALSFDGADDRVAVADSPTFNTNEVTFAFWIYPTALSKQWSTVMQRSNANGSWFDWQIYARAVDAPTPDHPVFRVDWDGDGHIDANEEVEGDVALATDTWYFIVCSYDGAQMKFYIDGTLRDSTSVSEGTIPNSGRDIWLGANDIWGEFFEGIIDEVRIYNRALSEEEIQLLAGF